MPKPKRPNQPKPSRRAPGTGSVGVRANGRVFAKLPKDLDPRQRARYGPGGRRRFADVGEATAWLGAEIARLRDPARRGLGRDEPFGAYVVRWHRDLGAIPARTADNYHRALLHFVDLAPVTVGELTHELIQAVVARLQRSTWRRKKRVNGKLVPYGPAYPYKTSSVKMLLSVLANALEHLVPHVLPVNPARRVKVARVQQPQQPVWDAGQADRFLAVALAHRPDLYVGLLLILRRALRRGEVLALALDDVDERRRLLRVDETAGIKTGETGDTKGRQVRHVPLSDELLDAIRAHRKRQQRPTLWLFPGREPGKPLSLRAFNAACTEIVRMAGLPPITPKDMRATAATILLDQNVSLARVSRLLGHSTIAVTASFYDRILANKQQRVDELAKELDEAFTRASAQAWQAEAATGAEPAPGASLEVSGEMPTR